MYPPAEEHRASSQAGFALTARWMALLILLLAAVALLLILGSPPLADEAFHHRQIRVLLSEVKRPFLPMLLGYHYTMVGVARVTGTQSLDAFRVASSILGLASVWAFFLCARRLDAQSSTRRTLWYFLFPVLFPLFFMVYTEPFSFLFLLIGTLGYLHNRYTLAGLAFGLSLLVRQSNIVWLVMLFGMIYTDHYGLRLGWRSIMQHLRRTWVFLLGLAGFGCFLLVNRGLVVATSPAAGQKILTGEFPLHTGSVFFSLLLVALLFLPLVIVKLPAISRSLRRDRRVLLGLLILFAAFLATYRVTHQWNLDEPWYIRNRILDFFGPGGLKSSLMFIPIGLGAMALAVTPLRRPSMYLLYPAWVLSLLPLWLICPRYILPQFVFLLLFMRSEHPRAELVTVLYFLVMTALIYVGVINEAFFV